MAITSFPPHVIEHYFEELKKIDTQITYLDRISSAPGEPYYSSWLEPHLTRTINKIDFFLGVIEMRPYYSQLRELRKTYEQMLENYHSASSSTHIINHQTNLP